MCVRITAQVDELPFRNVRFILQYFVLFFNSSVEMVCWHHVPFMSCHYRS